VKRFAELSEQEILALAISNEDEDSRIYRGFSEGLREAFPACETVTATALPATADMIVNASTVGMRAGDGLPGVVGDGGPATLARLAAPMGIAVVPAGKTVTIYIADSLNGRVRVIDPDGSITTSARANAIKARAPD